MACYPYVDLAEGIPPAPILSTILQSPDWAQSTKQYETDAFLDTGSDCTLVPLEVLSILELKILQTDVPIGGVGGGRITGFACYANITFAHLCFKAIRVYGCPGDFLSQRILIGRDILNQCCAKFDGLNLQVCFDEA